jgi:ribonuclease BN (tRNA processing enzyme)
MAYRLDCDGASVVYATDTAPFSDILLENEFIKTPPRLGDPPSPEHAAKLSSMRAGLVELCRGADLVIYDTQFTVEEYRQRPHWGHSTPDDALAISLDAGAKSLALFHFSPERSDDDQDAVLAATREKAAGTGLDVFAAQEQMEVTLGDD